MLHFAPGYNGGKLQLTMSITRGAPNTAYRLSQCSGTLGTITTGADGRGTGTFDWTGSAPDFGKKLAFMLAAAPPTSASTLQARLQYPRVQ